MKLQSLTIIFIIIILPVTLVLSAYIGYEIKTIEKQNLYNTGILSATHDAIFSFEINTKNDEYSNNPEFKRDILKAAVKTFENSFSTTCNLGLYGNDIIEEYIPAIVFGLYDGFYMYAPYETKANGYKHDLRSYVYYSETIPGTRIIIRYSLDNYVVVSGSFNGEYISRAGYLINTDVWESNFIQNSEVLTTYKKYDSQSKVINSITNQTELTDNAAKKYYDEAVAFTDWFKNTAKISDKADYLNIGNGNDPEDENSLFVQHKREIMKKKIQSILNSAITSYAVKTGNNYKMPILTEEEWEKIYSNISVISFVQGMNLGFKQYNNYCVLNSTNSNEYVNPNLMYFIDNNGEYHDIRCEKLRDATSIVGYKIGDFEKNKVEKYKEGSVDDLEEVYYYKHGETACYNCINGILKNTTPIYDYVRSLSESNDKELRIKKAYFSALARERYNTTKLSDVINSN